MPPPARLGLVWLATGVPSGALLGFVVQLADEAWVRRIGYGLLLLAAASAVLGTALLLTRSTRLRPVSLLLSALWLAATVVVVSVADFPSDRLWGGGLTLAVVVLTGAAALRTPRHRA